LGRPRHHRGARGAAHAAERARLRDVRARAVRLVDRHAAHRRALPTVRMRGAPRTLFLTHTAVLGGAERSLIDLAAAWPGERAVMMLADGPLRDALEQRGVPVVMGRLGALARVRRESLVPGVGALADIGRLGRDVAKEAKRMDV